MQFLSMLTNCMYNISMLTNLNANYEYVNYLIEKFCVVINK